MFGSCTIIEPLCEYARRRLQGSCSVGAGRASRASRQFGNRAPACNCSHMSNRLPSQRVRFRPSSPQLRRRNVQPVRLDSIRAQTAEFLQCGRLWPSSPRLQLQCRGVRLDRVSQVCRHTWPPWPPAAWACHPRAAPPPTGRRTPIQPLPHVHQHCGTSTPLPLRRRPCAL